MFLDTIKNNPTINNPTTRSVVAGAIGGLAGGAVKSLVEYFLPVRKAENRSAQLKIIDDLSTKITGTPISVQNEELAEQLVNFPVGASVGAAYGYGKKNKDGLNIAEGIIMGTSTWISTHQTSLPLMGLKDKPTDVPMKMQANEFIAHLLFGITTELVRNKVNQSLKK
ncbi:MULTISPECIES: DUF1440 domain-containing protein [unclassified Zunongwangia]|uniref:DUF1440 domain-containing protein n=1 Tax=unclassified Zunongwangia TaxID=2632541 RepID=UPI0022DDDC44|nr:MULTISPECIES: DUF1440 domain-containing protein [unclassified Zunongwangia]WBL22113.1 DUF1440 domain-containing protein [Zunongwangia sp. HRR-M8]WBL25938.1 DUF1440 domain-containing protein [Zunongwangia sp. HGR-M22]